MKDKCTITTPYLQSHAGNEPLIEFEHRKLGSIEDLVAELSVTFHAEDLKVDITTYRSNSQQTALVRVTPGHTSGRIRAECKPQGVTSTFRNTLGEVLLLASFSLGNLFVVQVALMELLVEGLEVHSLDDVNWVDDVSEGLAHLPSVCVSNHCMAIHLLERHLASQFDSQ